MAEKSPPKPPKPKEPADLAEVERALSVLQGRHPETERLRREDQEKRARRQAETDAVSKVEGRRLRMRRLGMGAAGAGVLLLAIVSAMIFRSEVARRGRLEQAGDPYRAMGFTLVDTSNRGEPSKLDSSVPAGCLLATSSVKDAKIKVTHAGGSTEGDGAVVLCLCEGEQVKITASGPGVVPGEGIVLLRTDASTLGGSLAFPFLPFKATPGVADGACAEASLDAWIEAKKYPQDSAITPISNIDSAAADKWFAADAKRAVLKSVGIKPTSLLKKDVPFIITDVPADTCVLVFNDKANASEQIRIRLKGGEDAVGRSGGGGHQAWCTSAATTVIVQRFGRASELTVLMGSASKVGGLYGLSEVAESAGIAFDASGVLPADRGWSAKQLLVASAIPESLITIANTPDLGTDLDARIVALSVTKPNVFVPETPPDTFSFCDPLLSKSTSSVCIFSGSQQWRVQGAEAVGGIARAKLPFWLFALQGVNEPAALKVQTAFITLARKLRREGFEPTTLDAVTELDKGAEILGRANEDAFVAVGIAPVDPWLFPYTDGPAWTIDPVTSATPPRVVAIKQLERIVVSASTTKPLPPKATRRTVVFRRRKASQ